PLCLLCLSMYRSFFFCWLGALRILHSFPTRRSSDLDFEDAVALVAKRGEFMETAAPQGTGKMVAVMNADADLIEEMCQKALVKGDRKSTRLNSSHVSISYAVFCLKKKNNQIENDVHN